MGDEFSLDRDKLTNEETYLIAPCGIYCGACDMMLGRSRSLAGEMYRILNGFNFADVGPFFMGVEQEGSGLSQHAGAMEQGRQVPRLPRRRGQSRVPDQNLRSKQGVHYVCQVRQCALQKERR